MISSCISSGDYCILQQFSLFSASLVCVLKFKFGFLLFFPLAAPKVNDHMLDQYRTSCMRIIKMQFTEKRLQTGQPGAAHLAKFMNLNEVLMGVNMSEKELCDPRLEPMTREEAVKFSTTTKTTKKSFSMNCGGEAVACGWCTKKRGKDSYEDEEDHEEVIQPQESRVMAERKTEA